MKNLTDSEILELGKEVFDIEIKELQNVLSFMDLSFTKAVRAILDCKGTEMIASLY